MMPYAARGVHELVTTKVVYTKVGGFRCSEMQRAGLCVELKIFSADDLYGSGSSLLANGDCGWWKLLTAINGEGGGAGRGVGIFSHAKGQGAVAIAVFGRAGEPFGIAVNEVESFGGESHLQLLRLMIGLPERLGKLIAFILLVESQNLG